MITIALTRTFLLHEGRCNTQQIRSGLGDDTSSDDVRGGDLIQNVESVEVKLMIQNTDSSVKIDWLFY